MEVTTKKSFPKIDGKSLKILKKIKSNFKVLVVDYDGTIFDTENSEFNHQKAADLLNSAMKKGVVPVVISARDVSFFQSVSPLLNLSLNKENESNCYYFAGGNGSYLLKVSDLKKEIVYSHNLNQSEIKNILRIYEKVTKKMNLTNNDLIESGVKAFSALLIKLGKKKHSVATELLNLSNKYEGAMFVEKSKISIVLPRDSQKKKLFENYLIDSLPENMAAKGDHSFLHISKKIKTDSGFIDGKLHALNTIIQLLGLSKEQLIVFGDSPMGNDQAMLNFLPHSFTNNEDFIPLNNSSLCFLAGASSPVEKVHRAIQFFLGNTQ